MEKNRVVAEAAVAGGSLGDLPFAPGFVSERLAGGHRNRDHAFEGRVAVFGPGHFGEKLFAAAGVGGPISTVASGANPGPTVEGVDHQPRVVGQCGQSEHAGGKACLLVCIFLEIGAVFDDLRNLAEIRQALDLHRVVFEQVADLGDFPGIAGCNDDTDGGLQNECPYFED